MTFRVASWIICLLTGSRSTVGCSQRLSSQDSAREGYIREYVVVDIRNTLKLPSEIDFFTASRMFCAGVKAYNAVMQCGIATGGSVALIGAGGQGQMAILYAKAMGLKVFVVDTNSRKLDRAKQLGAEYTINPNNCPQYANDIKRVTGGVDAAINFTPSHKAFDDMSLMLRWGGTRMIVGMANGPLQFDCSDLLSCGCIIKGSGSVTAEDLQQCLRFSIEYQIDPMMQLRTVEEIPHAFAMMETGKLLDRICVQL